MHSFSKVCWNEGMSWREFFQSVAIQCTCSVRQFTIYMHFAVFLQSRIEYIICVGHVHRNLCYNLNNKFAFVYRVHVFS